ncbi:MAG: hypothetical protein M1816_004643 [Peltula sp. TS41687]|nr:MAG: hypothetical protein M1816_004643 [Peltula sp. TS41687]
MHPQTFLFAAVTAFVATSALAIPLSPPPAADSSSLQRRDPPTWSRDNLPPDGSYQGREAAAPEAAQEAAAQEAANECFERDIQGLLEDEGHGWAEGYETVMKKCKQRHGKQAQVTPSTRKRLDQLAELWVRKSARAPKTGRKLKVIWNGLTPEQRAAAWESLREDSEMDERLIESIYGIPRGSKLSPNGPSTNGGSPQAGGNGNSNGNGNNGMNAFMSAKIKAVQDRFAHGMSKIGSSANLLKSVHAGPLLNGGGGMLLTPHPL